MPRVIRCAHCKQLAPAWSEAAGRAKGLHPPIPIAKVDAVENEEIAKRYDIEGYPTIKLVRGNEWVGWGGG